MSKAIGSIKKAFSYAISFIKGLTVTGKYLFMPAVTLQYPKERWTMPERFRGRVSLRPKKCISCQICARACPNYSLDIKVNISEDKKKTLGSFIYSMDKCVFCGLCAEQCPTSAIFMNHDYERAVYDRKLLIMDLIKVDANVE